MSFPEVTWNIGLLATESPGLIAELEKAMAAKRGGIVEISAEEHSSLLQKKTAENLKRPWREELSNEQIKARQHVLQKKGAPAAGRSGTETVEESLARDKGADLAHLVERPTATRR